MKTTMKKKTLVAVNVLAILGLAGFSGYEYKQIEKTNALLEKSEKTIVEHAKNIKELEGMNADLGKDKEALEAEFKLQSEELEKTKADVHSLQEGVTERDNTIASKDKEIADLKKMKASRKASATPTPTKAQAQPEQAPAKKPEVKAASTASANAMTFRATAYSSNEPLEMGGGVTTASGTRVTEGRTIAVDPRVIPLGSKVRITCPDYPSVNGVYIAEDTGGAIKGNIIDIYIHDLSEVNSFGRRTIQVEIL